ncbi:spore gernimation protein GerQ [Paenibacillus sp. 8b26]|uniref:spore gernimation protein GerQ n=1 Tax=Paenibacillus sp. 8b26 TaxID=3424133 RepID=UPI003D6622FF
MINQQSTLAAHESLEIHEALNFKTLCLAKSKLMQGLVFDQELKDLMEKDVQQSIQAIADLQAIYAKAPFQTPVPEFRPTPILN